MREECIAPATPAGGAPPPWRSLPSGRPGQGAPRCRPGLCLCGAEREECCTIGIRPAAGLRNTAGGAVPARMDAPEVGEAGRAAVDLVEASVVSDEEDRLQWTGHVGSSASMALVRTVLGSAAALPLLFALSG